MVVDPVRARQGDRRSLRRLNWPQVIAAGGFVVADSSPSRRSPMINSPTMMILTICGHS